MSSSSSPYPELSPSSDATSDVASHDDASPFQAAEIDLVSGDSASIIPTNPDTTQTQPEAQPTSAATGQESPTFDTATDGLTDRIFRSKSKGPIAAIFIHAGAGYHSTVNEHIHLEACSDAARIAMKFLKAGGTAVDAVEAAIKCLEDKEITNAGFGSNLSIDGVVEGDATIVDHLGRSGACGSVQLVKNPISLARLIYDRSNVPLTLRRIPPNVLVGHGAARFAQEHGMALVPHERLISKSAHDRFCRWRHDLQVADQTMRASRQASEAEASAAAALKAAVSSPTRTTNTVNRTVRDADAHPSAPQPKRMRLGEYDLFTNNDASSRRKQNKSGDGSYHEDRDEYTSIAEAITDSQATDHPAIVVKNSTEHKELFTDVGLNDNDTDIITDTIGAIAIDLRGNIAAGSSSGGIGMKHSGRMGPAALVGVGSAVVPANPKDSTGTSVAAVTSGTGEHMATTVASHTCCERLYHNQRRTEGGSFETEYDEDAIMKSFIADDFMNHPGVKNQVSGGAIGVLAAKKTNKGIYFYFAHNTDSFALASMSSNDPEPLVVLSRLRAKENVARGGRKIKPN